MSSFSIDRLVIASGNRGKLEEFEALLGPLGIEVLPQSAFGIDEVEETAATFVENALLKARHAARLSGLPALADDSGLCVDALAGQPGLRSARYAGVPADPAANIARLLDALRGLPQGARSAHFVCVLALLRHAEDPAPLIAEGRWHGRILDRARGGGGFGYDPVFLDPASGLSAAELPPADKHARSHRGRALAALLDRLADGRR